MIRFILGGARSGKSNYAEQCVQAQSTAAGTRPLYIATAENTDEEMANRIARHKQQRGEHWQLIESPYLLVETLHKQANQQSVILVDCLTLWLNNQMYTGITKMNPQGEYALQTHQKNTMMAQLEEQTHALVACLTDIKAKYPGCSVTLVSNEVGFSIVPLGLESRIFTDYQGWLNQAVAKVADEVVLVVAGQPLVVKASRLNDGA